MKFTKISIATTIKFSQILIALIILSSCDFGFTNPQPFNINSLRKIPTNFKGIYKGDNFLSKVEIKADNVVLEFREDFKGIKNVYFKRDGKEYVVKDEKEYEIFNAEIINDSVFGLVSYKYIFEMDESLALKKVNDYYVFNIKSESVWYPFFIAQNGDFLNVYSLESEILKKYNRNSEYLITDNLDKDDVKYFFKMKNTYLKLLYKLNMSNKSIQTINNEN
jgi:hypothetical protein